MKRYRTQDWMSPKVELRPSTIHGQGMFAVAPIKRHEVVAIWGGSFVNRAEAEKDEVTIIARRDIEPGGELTIDYAMLDAMFEADEDDVMPWECNCGSPACRKQITGKDWKSPELQERYGNHFSPMITRKITASS